MLALAPLPALLAVLAGWPAAADGKGSPMSLWQHEWIRRCSQRRATYYAPQPKITVGQDYLQDSVRLAGVVSLTRRAKQSLMSSAASSAKVYDLRTKGHNFESPWCPPDCCGVLLTNLGLFESPRTKHKNRVAFHGIDFNVVPCHICHIPLAEGQPCAVL